MGFDAKVVPARSPEEALAAAKGRDIDNALKRLVNAERTMRVAKEEHDSAVAEWIKVIREARR